MAMLAMAAVLSLGVGGVARQGLAWAVPPPPTMSALPQPTSLAPPAASPGWSGPAVAVISCLAAVAAAALSWILRGFWEHRHQPAAW